MANEKRLIDANVFIEDIKTEIVELWLNGLKGTPQPRDHLYDIINRIGEQPTVDAYTTEQIESIIKQANKREARNKELEKEVAWLKSCLNCKIRKECPRHCGKVVHDCDHWEYGDSTVDAVEVVHGRWEQVQRWATKAKYRCSVCGREIMSAVKVNIEKYPYCHCGAKMRGGNE